MMDGVFDSDVHEGDTSSVAAYQIDEALEEKRVIRDRTLARNLVALDRFTAFVMIKEELSKSRSRGMFVLLRRDWRL